MPPKTQINWIVGYLLPALEKGGFEHLKILVGEENRSSFPMLAEFLFQNGKVRNKTYGIAVHWYFDDRTSPEILDKMKELFPEKQILYTEACTGLDMNNYG